MTENFHIDSRRGKARFRPLKAWHHMQNLLRDNEATEEVFYIMEALNGNALERELRRFAASKNGPIHLKNRRFLPEILDDHATIRKLPMGTVGHAYVDFMEREGLSAAGLVAESEKWLSDSKKYDDDLEFMGNRLRDTHDLMHVLTGYGRDQLGETSLLAFTYSQEKGRGAMFISWIGGRDLAKVAPREARVMDAIWEGKKNGKRAAKIVEEDIVALLEEPLDAARERLNISKPLAYTRALEHLSTAGYEAIPSAA
jgi:ubiquinone biosynthesis protein COQ4